MPKLHACMYFVSYFLFSHALFLLGQLFTDDDNRIILQPLSGCSDCQRDYINASYVDVRVK